MTALTTDSIDAEIGKRAHALLWQQRHTQGQLARALGISGSVLSKKLRGESAWSAQQVARTAHFLGSTAGALYGESPLPSFTRVLRSLPGGGAHIQTSRPQLALVGAST